jgi:hypothetical protein
MTTHKEYPLFTQENADKCPTARFVAGVSRWLCECKEPSKCEGVMAARGVYSRKAYMNDPSHLTGAPAADRRAAHRRYYGQFVSEATIRRVVQAIGADALRRSTDQHLNDIPLEQWDRLTPHLPLARRFEAAGDYATLAGLVCVAKEAARQWLEQQQGGGAQS